MTGARFPDLDGASVVVTGGASGIGAALVTGFLRQGAQVALIDIADADQAADAMEEATGRRPLPLTCDVTDPAALDAALDRAATAHGGLRVLVNNAADDMRHDALDVTPATWDASLALNLDAYFHGCRKAATLMGADGGAIVNFSSITFQLGAAGMVPYMTANAGIVGLTRALAREWGPRDIRVNAVAPGWVLTEKQREKWASEAGIAAFKERQALKRMLEPDDMVGPVLFLASAASGAVTGQVLVADAGVVHSA